MPTRLDGAELSVMLWTARRPSQHVDTVTEPANEPLDRRDAA